VQLREGKEAMETYIRIPLYGTHEAIGLGGITRSDQENFVTKYYSQAELAAKPFGLNPLVILAQAALESGWGTSYMAKNIFNFFGITAFGKPNAFWDGTSYTSKTSGLKFRVYTNAEKGFSDHARLISSKYKEAASKSFDVNAYARAISLSPYISEANGDNREHYRIGIERNANTINLIRGAPAIKVSNPENKAAPTKAPPPTPASTTNKQATPETRNSNLGISLGLTALGLWAGSKWIGNKSKKKKL
jgi:peptidoglycan hydrolase FlgJ